MYVIVACMVSWFWRRQFEVDIRGIKSMVDRGCVLFRSVVVVGGVYLVVVLLCWLCRLFCFVQEVVLGLVLCLWSCGVCSVALAVLLLLWCC